MPKGPKGSPFFAYLYRLRLVKRWSLMWSPAPDSISEHTFNVALLAHALAVIGNSAMGRSYDAGRAVQLALFHDAPEVLVGDIASPIKHGTERMSAAIAEIEAAAAEQLMAMVPGDLRETYRELLIRGPGDADLMRLVKAADKLDGYLKCAIEVSQGNREFAVAKDELRAELDRLEMPELNHFLDNFGDAFDKTLDEISTA